MVFKSEIISIGALADRGANGGIVGRDMTIISVSDVRIDLSGLDEHTVRELSIVHAACVIESQNGPVITHWPQQASMPDSKSVLSTVQMEAHGCIVNDKPMKVTGEQPFIQSPDGYKFPLKTRQGLMYLDCRPVRDDEWEKMPHTYMCSDTPWDPRVYDGEVDKSWFGKQEETVDKKLEDMPYNKYGVMDSETATTVVDEFSDDDDNEGITLREVEINLTKLIEDELVDSVIEINVDGEIYQRHLNDDDLTCEWGDWEDHSAVNWQCYDVQGRRLRSRKPVDYADTKRRRNKSTPNPTTEVRPVSTRPQEEPTEAPNKDNPMPPIYEEDEDEASPRTDYNNKAKSTTQNDERIIGPYLGKPSKIHYADYARHFGGVPEARIEKTFRNTTQLGRLASLDGNRLWRRVKAPNPALNVFRRNEPVATDTVYGPTPAVDNGSTAAQFFIGRKSGYVSVEPLGTSDKRFPIALMNEIRKRGAMDVLISDNAQAQISHRVEEILGTFGIKDVQSEPHNKNQNFAERGYQDVQRMYTRMMNYSGAPGFCWLLALCFAAYITNHLAHERLGWRTPAEWLTGHTPDITVLMAFIFYQPVYYRQFDTENSEEELGRFVGIAESVGHSMTYKILTKDLKVISRSLVRPATKTGVFDNQRAAKQTTGTPIEPVEPNATVKVGNKHVDVVIPETVTEDDEDLEDDLDEATEEKLDTSTVHEDKASTGLESEAAQASDEFLDTAMKEILERGGKLPTLDSADLLGRTYITDPDDEGEQHRAKIVDVGVLEERTPDGMQPLFRFRSKVGDKTFEEIITYNRMLEWCDRDKDKDDFYRIDGILGHRKNSSARGGYQVLVKWASAKADWRDLALIFNDDPVTVSLYAKKKGLLSTPGWRRCKRYIRNGKNLGRAINQVRLKNNRNRPRYKYGYQVPRDHNEAMLIDEKNGNDKWAKSEELELSQIVDYDTFKSLGIGAPIPEGYTKIPCHMVHDIKASGRHKSRFVAGGHRTSTPTDATYSGVVSLQGIRLVTFIAELNDLEIWGTDIGNAYLESYTSEKVAFIAGPEFGKYAGHTCIIQKALYGLKSSGKCWHDRLHDVLRDMGFFPSKAEEDIWMRDMGDHYEYLAVYVDDLLIASKKPQDIIDALEKKPNNFKLKGTGPVTFHLGCDFFRDPDGTLCFGPKKYIGRMVDQYKVLFGQAPSQRVHSPLEKNDHPELDDTELLDDDGIAKYQSLIGALQWVITLGRFDIATAVMTMSSFRAAPRQGHMDRVKRIVGYISKFRHAAIRVRTEVPDYSDLPYKEYDWARTVYGRVREQRVTDAPKAKGPRVVTTTYKDANLYHDLATGRAVTGVLHFVNQTPIEWFSKKQSTVETATYGSEFVAAKVAIQQIAGLRITLQYLGVNLDGCSYLFGDNQSVVTSGTVPHSQLSKRHQALAYHYTREAVASKMVAFHHIGGDQNPADILSKHWAHHSVYPMLRPLLFYQGDTIDLLEEQAATKK